MPEFVLPVTEDEYEKAGSKFITFDPNAPAGRLLYLGIEMDMPDWETPGQSIKFPIRVTEEGPDFGKEDKIVGGITRDGIWKTKDILKALDIVPEMRVGADQKKHPVITNETVLGVAGKLAVGCWQIQVDSRAPEKGGKGTKYPKLVNIYPAGYTPATEELV